MERKRILIAVKVTQEVKQLRAALVSSGYEVKVVDNGASALALSRQFRPHLMLSEIDLPKIDGHHLLREIKSQSATKQFPFILISRHRSVEERVHSMNLDIDDYVTTPFEPNQVVLRIEIILKEIEKFESSSNNNSKSFSGKLTELNLVEILQTLQISQKSGIIKIQNDNKEGFVFVKEGVILDATLGDLQPKNALFRMFSWSDGTFQVEIRNIEQTKIFTESIEDLIYKGLIFRDRWKKLTSHLPPLQATVTSVPKLFGSILTVDEKSLLNLITDKIRLVDLVEASQFDDFKTLNIIAKLFSRGLIIEVQPDEIVAKAETSKYYNNITIDNKDTRLSKLIVNFINYKNQVSKKSIIDRRRADRRRIERRRRNRRWADSIVEDAQIYLNKSELLMIREKLASDVNGNDHLEKVF